jgi:hypothetical protein
MVIISSVVAFAILNFSYSNGVRTGRLVKLSKVGMIIKTYEGTLDLGSGDNLTWDFSVHDDSIGDKLITQTGKLISLQYKERLYRFFYRTKYDVVSYEMINDTKPAEDNLCQLARVIKLDPDLVDKVRDLVLKNRPELLEKIRSCF